MLESDECQCQGSFFVFVVFTSKSFERSPLCTGFGFLVKTHS